MNSNRRIFINIIATYGRSLYALLIGLFTGRWVLMALGESDYGLYGVVAGLTVFISFINGLLSSSLARFFAYSIGKDSKRAQGAALECQQWFNTALMIHIIVPVMLMAIGYPIGEWVVRNWLTIPPNRIDAFVSVFRCVCMSCFVSMVNIPFTAMFTAKQYIAELTIYGVVVSTCQVCFLYYIASHSGDWLMPYAIWSCILATLPQIVICIRAFMIFSECKIVLRYCWDLNRLRQLCYFAGSLAFGGVGGILRGQGIAILINKYFGSSVNAAMSVANSVNGQSMALVSAMQGAFTPAIVQAYGAGDENLMRKMAFRACKFGVILVVIFAIPLALEMDNVMTLWLKNPPPYSAGLCICMLALVAVDKSTIGHMIAVNAKGKIAIYQMILGCGLILTLPIAWLFVEFGFGVYSVGVVLLVMTVICSIGRVVLAHSLVGMNFMCWVTKVVAPTLLVMMLSILVGYIPRMLYPPSIWRLCATVFVVECVCLPATYFLIFNNDERAYFKIHVKSILRRLLCIQKNEAKVFFKYDFDRFLKFSGAYGPISEKKLLAKLIKEYHVVEKCLTMPDRIVGHGKTAVENLINSMKLYESSNYDVSNHQFLHAIGVLKAYLEINPLDGILRDSLCAFISRYPDVVTARQLHYTKGEFYVNKNASFPEFALSRHTIRHFSHTPLTPKRIADAVNCARYSPSACNRQYVKIKACFNHDTIKKILDLQGGSRGFGHLATALLVVTVDLQGVGSCRERNDVYTNGGMFMMSLCYAMHYYEIANCILNWSKSPNEDIILRSIINIPKSETIVAIIACGETPEEFDVAVSPKNNVDSILTIFQ